MSAFLEAFEQEVVPTQVEQHWEVLRLPVVDEMVRWLVRVLVREYDVADEEDLLQEARLMVATRPGLHECVLVADDAIDLMRYRLRQDLVDHLETPARQAKATTSLVAPHEYEEDSLRPVAPTPLRDYGAAYDRALVEALLPAVWDSQYAYGMQAENAPDADMPRGTINKATNGTLAAHLADIRTGWKRAPLTLKERRALFLAYAVGDTQAAIGAHEGCIQPVIATRIASGIGKIVATLNGESLTNRFTEGEAA